MLLDRKTSEIDKLIILKKLLKKIFFFYLNCKTDWCSSTNFKHKT